jgi:signal transduction histidine kinase
MEFRIRCKNGSHRIVVINALIYEDMLLIAHLDITERQHAEAALIAARNREKSLEQEQRIKLESKLRSSLAASAVAHEINQPLSTILLQSNMPLRDSSQAGKVLRSIAAEAQRVVSTIEKMKVLLRNVQTTAKPVNLAQVVKSSVLQVKRTLEQNRIHVRHQNTPKACRIEGDDAHTSGYNKGLQDAIKVVNADSVASGLVINGHNVAKSLAESLRGMIIQKEKSNGKKKTRGN